MFDTIIPGKYYSEYCDDYLVILNSNKEITRYYFIIKNVYITKKRGDKIKTSDLIMYMKTYNYFRKTKCLTE